MQHVTLPSHVKGWCAKCDLPVLVGDGTATAHRNCDTGDRWIHDLYRDAEKDLPYSAGADDRNRLAGDILKAIRAQRPERPS